MSLYWKNSNILKSENIHEYYHAKKYRDQICKKTRLVEKIPGKLFIKMESEQLGGSFKSNSIPHQIVDIYKYATSNTYISTQSTGNHAISLLHCMIEAYKLWGVSNENVNIIPVIFATKNLPLHLNDKLNRLLNMYRKITGCEEGFIDTESKDYAEATSRINKFSEKNLNIKIEHASDTTLNGFGTIGIDIHEQLNEFGIKGRVEIYITSASGGSLGIGYALSCLRETDIILCQPNGQDALIRSIISNKIEMNKPIKENEIVIRGLCVDKPEENALYRAKQYISEAISLPIYKKDISSICDSCNVSYEAYKLYNTGLPAIIINYENVLKINFNNII